MSDTEALAIAASMAKALSASGRRNLLALPESGWMTVSEMRGYGATGSGMDLLYIFYTPSLCERRWTTWGSDRVHGQLRGEGYEYSILPLGLRVRSILLEQK